jgi:hypothetical protein
MQGIGFFILESIKKKINEVKVFWGDGGLM